MDGLQKKYIVLKRNLQELGSVAVAYSSGVDSTFLLKAAVDVLGKDNVLAVTALSPSFPDRERAEAERFCTGQGIRQVFCESNELEIEGFRQNPKNRCYLCKRELFGKMLKIAEENGMAHVVEGSNVDDRGDYRPGLAAVKELGIKSPLFDAGLKKEEIRQLSKQMGLPTWNKPSFACLASRFVYGEVINEERLLMVDQAEQFLLDMGFCQVRVRIHGQEHGTVARIEVMPEEFGKLIMMQDRERLSSYFKEIGFSYVTVDLDGYRTGSMNETIEYQEL